MASLFIRSSREGRGERSREVERGDEVSVVLFVNKRGDSCEGKRNGMVLFNFHETLFLNSMLVSDADVVFGR